MSDLYNELDCEAIKKLDAFLPDKIFDAHMHISEFPFGGKERFGFKEYYEDIVPAFSGRSIRCNGIIAPTKELKMEEARESTLNFLTDQLDSYPENVGEIMIFPTDKPEDIESRITHDRIKGIKCYHSYAIRENTLDAEVNEYLPESALEIANKRKMPITLHMVKDNSLADPENMKQIKRIAEKYPDLTLILAHSARAFAAWTAIETVGELRNYGNIMYDFSAVCESPSIMYIIKTVGAKRCMWGSDYNVCNVRGKAISIANSFCWINSDQLNSIFPSDPVPTQRIIIENLMAMRQAATLLGLTPTEKEDIFYNNARELFK